MVPLQAEDLDMKVTLLIKPLDLILTVREILRHIALTKATMRKRVWKERFVFILYGSFKSQRITSKSFKVISQREAAWWTVNRTTSDISTIPSAGADNTATAVATRSAKIIILAMSK